MSAVARRHHFGQWDFQGGHRSQWHLRAERLHRHLHAQRCPPLLRLLAANAQRHRAARHHRPGLYRPKYVRTSSFELQNWPPLPATPVLNPITATSFDSYEVTWSSPGTPSPTPWRRQQHLVLRSNDGIRWTFDIWQASGKAAGDYCYHVRASNQYGTGPWSNARCITLAQLQDDFSNPHSGWPVESDEYALVGYESGEW